MRGAPLQGGGYFHGRNQILFSRRYLLHSSIPAAFFGILYAALFSWIGWRGATGSGGKWEIALSVGAGVLLPMMQHFFLQLFYEKFLTAEKESLLARLLGSHSYLREKEDPSVLLQKLHVDFPAHVEAEFYYRGEFVSGLAQLLLLGGVVGILAPALMVGICIALAFGFALSLLYRSLSSRFFEIRRAAETRVFYAEKNFIEGLEYLRVNPRFHRLAQKIVSFTKDATRWDRKVGAVQDSQIAISGGIKFLAVAALSTVILLPFSFKPENFYWLYLFLGAGSTLNMSLQRKRTARLHGAKIKDFFEAPQLAERREFHGAGIEVQGLEISFSRTNFSPDLGPLFFNWKESDRILVNGRSGRGKTTLLRTLLGLHSFWKGRIRIGAGTISYLSQDPFHLDGATLAENLGLEFDQLSKVDQRIKENQARTLLSHLGLESFSLPQGLQTPMGSSGVSPSKGQWKRIALARELLRQPTIMILDEPLAGLDSVSAAQLVHCIRKNLPHCLLVVAEHRDEILEYLEPTQILSVENRRSSACLPSTHATVTF